MPTCVAWRKQRCANRVHCAPSDARPCNPATQAVIVGTALDIPLDQITHVTQRAKPHVELKDDILVVGRTSLKAVQVRAGKVRDNQSFAYTRHVLCLMERLITCVNRHEPVLLVGETGTGKTTAVQQLAVLTNRKLVVVNMSQQNDSSDLLGGFKPVDVRLIAHPAMELFESLFFKTFSRKRNQPLMDAIRLSYIKGKWDMFTKALQAVLNKVDARLNPSEEVRCHPHPHPPRLPCRRSLCRRKHACFASP